MHQDFRNYITDLGITKTKANTKKKCWQAINPRKIRSPIWTYCKTHSRITISTVNNHHTTHRVISVKSSGCRNHIIKLFPFTIRNHIITPFNTSGIPANTDWNFSIFAWNPSPRTLKSSSPLPLLTLDDRFSGRKEPVPIFFTVSTETKQKSQRVLKRSR